MSEPKYCDDPDHCTYSDCPTAFCDKGKHSLAAPAGCAALVAKIKDARTLSHGCWVAGYANDNKRQRHYSAGQLDAFDAVLSWIAEAQHNSSIEPHK